MKFMAGNDGHLQLVITAVDRRDPVNSPVDIRTIYHYLQGFLFLSQVVVRRISEPSTCPGKFRSDKGVLEFHYIHVLTGVLESTPLKIKNKKTPN